MSDFVLPEGLVCGDPRTALSKINNFRKNGAERLQVIFDFDRTLTVARPDSKDDITTWNILAKHLPEEGQRRHLEIFSQMRPKELAGTLTPDDAAAAWAAMLDMFTEYLINLNEVEHDFLAKATIRPGAKEIFDFCAMYNIPTIILSAGIKNVIDIWARAYGINPSIVLSTVLQTDAQGRMRGWDKDTLVHVLNKNEVTHPELASIQKQRRHAIVIGDSINDADMASGDAAFRIRIHDSRPDDADKTDIVRLQTFRHFDAIIEIGSLMPIRELIESIVTDT